MRLSEAIRLGAMLKPQGFGDLWTGGVRAVEGRLVDTPVHSCALGAAWDALGCGWRDPLKDPPPAICAFLNQPAICPSCFLRRRANLGQIVAHLNDHHRWTRERIADWVESQEARAAVSMGDASDPHAVHPGHLATRV